MKTKAQNDRRNNSHYLKNVPIFPPFHPINENAFEGKYLLLHSVPHGACLLFSTFFLIIISELRVCIRSFSDVCAIYLFICMYVQMCVCACAHTCGD